MIRGVDTARIPDESYYYYYYYYPVKVPGGFNMLDIT
jgi:hypothetical protein